MSQQKATLTVNDKQQELSILESSYGNLQIDISNLGKDCGLFTFDPGFVSTASCESKISYIDGQNSVLLYRGYPIEQLAEQADYLETCYLLLNGELPNRSEKNALVEQINELSTVEPQIVLLCQSFSRKAHPMAMLLSMVGATSAHYHDEIDIHDSASRQRVAMRLIAQMPTLTAMVYRHSQGKAFISPRHDLSYTENFLYMLHAESNDENWMPDPVLSQAMDKIFTLHADHGQNASTSTVRMAGSTDTNPYAAIAAGIAALWGPAHGGANEACLKMLNEIASTDRIPHYIEKAKDKDDPFRLMGFGHRVYKSYDPRAKIMSQTCHQVLKQIDDEDDPILQTAMALEKIALQDEYFLERHLYPNVDFYSGITLSALNIPSNMFTVIFALARSSGWISHWHEMLSNPYRIARPRQLYTGEKKRDFVPCDQR